VIASSVERILATVDNDAVVLDIGAWGKPFTRANWVLDHMPYETRGLYGRDGSDPERFSKDTWIQRDVCDKEPYPFADKSVDFVICSHTLEDVRDPIWVCSEINRIGKAGYIEVPSRLEEQSFGFQGPWVGWGHHHWLIEAVDGALDFSFKHHVMHGRPSDHFPPGFRDRLSDEERVLTFWWSEQFGYRERKFPGPEDLDPYLADFVARELSRRWPDYQPPAAGGAVSRRLRRLLG
jgi:hypothetical protein